MDYDQLIEIAKRRGYVRWEPSHLVEQLLMPHVSASPEFALQVRMLAQEGHVVWARALIADRRAHPIYWTYPDGTSREFFRCEEITLDVPVTFDQLVPRRYRVLG